MLYGDFVKKLKQLNPLLVFVPGRNISSGLYIKRGRDDLGDKGLVHLFGIPSPHLFLSMPKFSFHDEKGQIHRGYKAILKLLIGKGLVSSRKVKDLFGNSYLLGVNGEDIRIPQRKLRGFQLQNMAAGEVFKDAVLG